MFYYYQCCFRKGETDFKGGGGGGGQSKHLSYITIMIFKWGKLLSRGKEGDYGPFAKRKKFFFSTVFLQVKFYSQELI